MGGGDIRDRKIGARRQKVCFVLCFFRAKVVGWRDRTLKKKTNVITVACFRLVTRIRARHHLTTKQKKRAGANWKFKINHVSLFLSLLDYKLGKEKREKIAQKKRRCPYYIENMPVRVRWWWWWWWWPDDKRRHCWNSSGAGNDIS